MTYSILVAGVGGQGILLSSDLISICAMEAGYDVKKSEVHGMAQRGGAVVSCVRFGEKVYSPLITHGEADFILSFEKLEALRWAEYIKDGGIFIVNNFEFPTLAMNIGDEEYPEKIEEKLKKFGEVYIIDGLSLARKAGDPRVTNVVLCGALAFMMKEKGIDLGDENWQKAIEKRVPKKYLEINKSAFKMGFDAMKEIYEESQKEGG